MDDWEDMIESGQYYMADLNDAWLKAMLKSDPKEQLATSSSPNPVSASGRVSSSDPASSSDAVCSSSSRIEPPSDGARASGATVGTIKPAQKRKVASSGLSNASKSSIDTMSDGDVDITTAEDAKKLLGESTRVSSAKEKADFDFDSDTDVEELGVKLTAFDAGTGPEYEDSDEEAQRHIPAKAANKRIPPPLILANEGRAPENPVPERPPSTLDVKGTNNVQLVRSMYHFSAL
ncbi:hypothetical protein AA313_de0201848 [Arthrobotrys entomopaga]|nr:hypothetical protein AA313_de0201848 [Arthrobotrys entomopaga]